MTDEMKKEMEELHYVWAKSAAKNILNEVLGRSLGRVPFKEGFQKAVELMEKDRDEWKAWAEKLAKALRVIEVMSEDEKAERTAQEALQPFETFRKAKGEK